MRQRNIQRAFACLVLAAASIAGYLAMADLGIPVPGWTAIQLALDRREISIFRRVPDESVIRAEASKLREALMASLANVRDEHGRFTQHPKSNGRWDLGSHHQAMVALQRVPDISARKLLGGIDQLRAGFLTPMESTEPNIARWWLNPPKQEAPWDGIGHCWHIISSAMFAQDSERCPPDLRKQIAIDLTTLVGSLDRYKAPIVGEWNIYPNQLPGQPSNAYSSVMALHALLEVRRAGLTWGQGNDDSNPLIAATAARLFDHYRSDGHEPGWHGTGQDEDERLDGLTLQITALLFRAAHEAEISLPDAWVKTSTAMLIGCGDRDWDFPSASGEFEADILWHGEKLHLAEAIRFLWYPWALEAIHWWQLYEEKNPQPPETRFRIRRARAHLIMNVGPKLVENIAQDWTFVIAETLNGLGTIPAKMF